MKIPYAKKTQILSARLLSVKPAMKNIDPVVTTQRAPKRLAKALAKAPG